MDQPAVRKYFFFANLLPIEIATGRNLYLLSSS